MSSLWVLESKAYPDDLRSTETKTAKYWLRPGTYTVGRGTAADISIFEDNSISRMHAIVTVPSLQEIKEGSGAGVPYVEIQDKSKFGTLVVDGKAKKFDVKSPVGQTSIARNKFLIRFGSLSPFRIHNICKYVCFHKIDSTPKEIRMALDSLGLPRVENLLQKPEAILITKNRRAFVDGQILCALLMKREIMCSDWITAWFSQKVWKNQHPTEAKYFTTLVHGPESSPISFESNAGDIYENTKGVMDSKSFFLSAQTSIFDASLEDALSLLGARVKKLPEGSLNVKELKNLPDGSIVVVTDTELDSMVRNSHPKKMVGHFWCTTPGLLISAILSNSFEECLRIFGDRPKRSLLDTMDGKSTDSNVQGVLEHVDQPEDGDHISHDKFAEQMSQSSQGMETESSEAEDSLRTMQKTFKRQKLWNAHGYEANQIDDEKMANAGQTESKLPMNELIKSCGNHLDHRRNGSGWKICFRANISADMYSSKTCRITKEENKSEYAGGESDHKEMVTHKALELFEAGIFSKDVSKKTDRRNKSMSLSSKENTRNNQNSESTNYKAFRKKEKSCAARLINNIVQFDERPYVKMLDMKAYYQAEEQKKRKEKMAEKLFDMDIKKLTGKKAREAQEVMARILG